VWIAEEVKLKACFRLSFWWTLVLVVAALALLVPVSKVSADDLVVTFPDPVLQMIIREAIGKPTGDIYQSDLRNIVNLNSSRNKISNLTGLEYCTAITELTLSSNQITNIAPLAFLTNLEILELENNQIIDISPLAYLEKLTYLTLGNNRISDISPLAANPGLSRATNIYLLGNPLSTESMDTYIPQLLSRGIFVHYDSAGPVTPTPVLSPTSVQGPSRLTPFSDAQIKEMEVNNWRFRNEVEKQLDELDKKNNKEMVYFVIGGICTLIVIGIIVIVLKSVFRRRH
jgi:Leucine-rich repeat (LRR) protein